MPTMWDQFQPYTGGGEEGGVPTGAYVPGVNTPDAGLRGPELLAHLERTDPMSAAAIKDMLSGGITATGRNMQKYLPMASLVDPTFDMNTYNARRQLRTDLEKGSPQSIGGQVKNSTTAMEHFANAADAAVALHNFGGFGIAPLARIENQARMLGTDYAGRRKALDTATGRYGQEITKFYAGSPGGQQERRDFEERASGASSPTELADLLESELNLIPAKADQIRDQISDTLKGNHPAWVDTEMKRQEAAKARTLAAIAQLRGGAAVAPAAAGPPAQADPLEGRMARNPQTGQTIIRKNGQWVGM